MRWRPTWRSALDATLVVQNEAGAGGLVATNKTVAAADENRFQIVNTVGLVSRRSPARRAPASTSTTSTGSAASPPPANVIVVNNDSPYGSFQDMVDAGETVRFVAQGPGANGDYLAPTILGEAYDFDYEIVTGFAGSPEARQAVIAGDADAHILPVDSQLPAIEARSPRWSRSRRRPTRCCPTCRRSTTPRRRRVTRRRLSTARGARPDRPRTDRLAADGRDRLQALRDAWTCVAENEEAVADLERQRPIQSLDGEETAALVAEVLESPESFRTLVTESY